MPFSRTQASLFGKYPIVTATALMASLRLDPLYTPKAFRAEAKRAFDKLVRHSIPEVADLQKVLAVNLVSHQEPIWELAPAIVAEVFDAFLGGRRLHPYELDMLVGQVCRMYYYDPERPWLLTEEHVRKSLLLFASAAPNSKKTLHWTHLRCIIYTWLITMSDVEGWSSLGEYVHEELRRSVKIAKMWAKKLIGEDRNTLLTWEELVQGNITVLKTIRDQIPIAEDDTMEETDHNPGFEMRKGFKNEFPFARDISNLNHLTDKEKECPPLFLSETTASPRQLLSEFISELEHLLRHLHYESREVDLVEWIKFKAEYLPEEEEEEEEEEDTAKDREATTNTCAHFAERLAAGLDATMNGPTMHW